MPTGVYKRKPFTEEHKRKIGEVQRGRKLSEKTKRKMSQPRTEKHRKNISKAKKGAKSHFWKGGVTLESKRIRMSIEFRLWREAVFARDGWTCQKCAVRSGEGKTIYLHPHHIQNFAEYPELRFAIDNGITFCEKCHRGFHKDYGRKNNTIEQVETFLLKSI